MRKWTTLAAGVGLFILERGLDVSGFESIPLAIALWSTGFLLIVSAALVVGWPKLRERRALAPIPILVRHIPEERSDWELSDSQWVHIGVVNNAATDDFVAQIVQIEGTMEKQRPWSVKWRGYSGEHRRIFHGSEELLDLALVTAPVEEPDGVKDAVKTGVFRFFSVSCPEGWDVHGGPRELVGSLVELSKRTPYDECITLILKVTSSGTHESRNYSATKRIRLTFEVPSLEAEGGLRVQIEDLPDS